MTVGMFIMPLSALCMASGNMKDIKRRAEFEGRVMMP